MACWWLLPRRICHAQVRHNLPQCTRMIHGSKDFQPLKTGKFTQTMPTLGNQYDTDWFLKSCLASLMPKEVHSTINPDLCRFGADVATSIYDLHLQCEAEPPWLQQFDAWGNRIDKIHTSEAWKQQKRISAQEGLVAIAYEREFGEYSRIYQAAKLLLYSPSSGLYGCPLAMTDGAARSIDERGVPDYMRKAYSHLTNREPSQFWTSGQWMTEKGGGSDVANGTETLAYPQSDGSYALHGYKWFSSATDSDMALALARVVGPNGSVIEGTKGLSMFYLETRLPDGHLDNIQVVRLKNKLGTRQLPTAELLLTGTKAHLVGEEGRGIPAISSMLTITRMYNTIFASSATRRIVELCKAYSMKRRAYGQPICKYPIHMRTLANMELQTQSSYLLVMEMARLVGLEENGKDTSDTALLLRLLTPVAKIYTAKVAVRVISEGLECFGGLGYIEDTGLPAMLRDAQVLPIWEGTTNILSLDVLRAIERTQGQAVTAFATHCQTILSECEDNSSIIKLKESVELLTRCLSDGYQLIAEDGLRARELSFSIANVYIGVLFAQLANNCKQEKILQVSLTRWCTQDLLPVITALANERKGSLSAQEDWEMTMKSYENID